MHDLVLKADDVSRGAGVVQRILLLEAFGDADHFGVGLLAGDAGFETSQRENAGMPVAILRERGSPRSERDENVDGLEDLEAGGKNANDSVGASVEIDGLAEDFG